MPLILRTNKTEPLTHTELDGNLSHLDQRITALTNAEANKIITWTEIQSKPVLFDGDYNSLSNLPSLFNGDYNNLTNTPVIFDGNYQSLTNKPSIPSNLTDLANVQNTVPGIDQVLTWNGSSWSPQDKFSADYNDLTNKPVVPTLLGDLSNVSPTAPAQDEVLKWDGSQWAPGSDVGNIPTYAEVTDKNTANGPSKIAIGTIAGSTNQGNLAVAIGYEAGKTNQGANSIAIGVNAGETTQSTNATAVGISAGETTQGANATALGYYAGNANQGSEAVAIGDLAGSTNQGANATAVGNGAGEDTQGISAVAIGDVAGTLNQNTFAVAVGASAGMSSQGQAAVAIGKNSGETLQGSDTVAIGNSAGNANQTAKAVAIGDWAGKTAQGASAVALGHLAGTTNQGQYATALGHYAGANNQSSNAIAVGYNAAYENQGVQSIAIGVSTANNQGANAIAIGASAANNTQSEKAIAIGFQAGNGTQGEQAIAIGTDAGLTTQSDYAIAIGQEAGKTTQGTLALAVGNSAGVTSQGDGAVALGYTAGNASQGIQAIAIGHAAGTTTQGTKAIAIGEDAGNASQGINAIAVGSDAGKTSQGNDGVAIGTSAALVTQGINSVAIGNLAANNNQGDNAIAIGPDAGKTTQGDYAIAIGNAAGETNQAANSIVMNATSTAVENTTADSFVVKPIRNAGGTHQLEYNPTTGEITYDALGAGGYGNSDVDQHLALRFSPTDGYVLSWNTTTVDYEWVAQTGGSATTLSGLTDVDSGDTPTTGDMILWDGSEWKYILLEDEINTRISTQVYSDAKVDLHLNQSNPTSGYVLSWNGSDYAWVAQSSGGIALGDLSVGAEDPASGDGGISYDNTTGVFTYAPPDLSQYQPVGNLNADIDAHLNTSTATANQILSWNGTDYLWVADQTSAGGTDTVIAPFAFARVATTSNGSGNGISWGNYNSDDGSLDFTFDNAQADTNYVVVTDAETFDDYHVGISSKTVNGFTAEFYDSSGTRLPSSFSPFGIIVYGSTPTITITGSNISNASIGALNDVSISSATTGQVLKYNGSSWVNDTDAGGSVTNMASLTDVDSSDTVDGGDFLLFDDISSEYKFVAFESEVNGLIDSRTGGSGHISTQSQYTTKVITDASDPTNTAHHVLSNTGTSVQGASTAWYYGDVVSDPANPTTSVVLDIDSATLTGNVMGELNGDVKTADGGTLILDVDAGAGTAMYTGDVTGNVTGNVTGFVENEFDLTGSTSSNYVFNADSKYFTSNTNNPTLYLKRGERYKFKNIDGAHPFRIQSVNSAGGTLYNDGVTNNGGTGTVTFIPPMDAPDELYYYCANHSAMNGVIKIVGEGGTAPVTSVNTQTGVVVLDTDDVAEGTNNLYIQTRTTGAATATSLGDESAADITIPCAKTFTLLKIQTSHAAWVTLYIDTASRTNDAGRDINTDPEAGSGVLAEVITSDGSTINITPGTIGWNNDGTPAAQVYAKVVNKSGSQQDITVTLHYVALEV